MVGMDLARRLAEELGRRRRERGMSQLHLADSAGVNPSVVSRAERGRDARVTTWEKLFDGLGYHLHIGTREQCEESVDFLLEEADLRRERRNEGLCTGKRRF